MNKTTKGGLAAGAAAVLLMGGVGSLAYWTDSTTLNGGSITSGSLKLTAPACDTAGWVYAGTTKAAVAFVPGDKVTRSCTFRITATGDNLKATLNTPAVTFPAATGSLKLTPTAVYTIGTRAAGNGDNTITSADNGATVTAAITVDIPFGTKSPVGTTPSTGGINENDMQLTTATLNAITVTATQVKDTLNTGSN